ncbi:unnamed protein product [Prorocentrum cordatum]|uniref:Sugar phosphate transporter domain-containing protein n=1 Tax=Prorocentrum cordatum TaxID=2364126 RepID=A0ABN9XYQ3_9DINO|nr:unnamed protein product [Polarella glacialis]
MSAARCCWLLAVAGSSAVMDPKGRAGISGGPETRRLIVGDGSKVHVSVEVLESGGMLFGTTAIEEPACIGTADLCTQLGVSWLALVLGGGVFVILPRCQTLAQLLLFVGAQNFMNLSYMKAILSIHTVSQDRLNMRSFQALLVLTAMQQLVGFLFLALAILVSQLTPWAYRPHTIVSKDQAFAVMALAVCFTLNIALNNFSLSLLDMSVNVLVRSTSPLMSLLLHSKRAPTSSASHAPSDLTSLRRNSLTSGTQLQGSRLGIEGVPSGARAHGVRRVISRPDGRG